MKKELVPEIRFPDYENAPNWSSPQLGEISDRITKKVGDRKLTTVSITAGKGFVSQAEKFSRDISGKQYKNYIVLKAGEFSYNKGNSKTFPQGAVYRLKEFEEVAAPNAFISFRFKEGYVPDFYKGYFDNNYHGRQILKFITSGARSDGLLNISPDDFFSITLPTPIDRGEQQKIADCLSSLDELITVHTQKHEALQSYKKGLMQNLFPAEGETVPALRFPEFENAEDWEDKPLKKVFSIFQGYAFSSNDAVKEGARWLKIADVGIQFMNHKSPSFLPIKHTAEHKRNLVKKGDHVVALTRPFLSGRLKIAVVDDVFHEALLNQRVGKIVALQNSSFVYYLLQTTRLISEIEKSIAGSEPPNLSAQQIEDIETYIPSKEEQKKIADRLSSVDDLINAQAQKIQELKAHKKGLMQQLFPAMDEVTA